MERYRKEFSDNNKSITDSVFLNMDQIFSKSVLNRLSHEMRTNLNGVVAMSYLLSEDKADTETKIEISDKIYDLCRQLIGLFDNFLDSAVIRESGAESEPKRWRMNDLFDSLFSEFREILEKNNGGHVILVVENQANCREEIYLDTDWLRKVVRNLFMNSLQHTSAGYITTGYYLRDETVHFTIKDSGTGYAVSKEFLNTNNIAESLNKYGNINTAINLSLVRKLTELLGGRIEIKCNGLTGSGIHLSFPVKPAGSIDNSINTPSNSRITI